ncbi:MAG: GntR family transcriptional regulator [Spirochaetia bacterium]
MTEEKIITVDRNRALPLYCQVSECLEEMIKKGEIRPDEQMLSEDLLAARFGVSRPTINKAIAILIRKSIISRERGKGTFVRSGDVRLTLMQELVSLHESMQRENIRFRTVVLKVQRQKSNGILAEKLALKQGARIYYLKRLRYVEEESFIISESYLPQELFPDLEKEDLRDRSLYDVLEQKYGIPVIKTERSARAVKALNKEAELLRIPLGDPLIQLEGIAFSRQDLRVEYFKTIIRGDRGVLCTTLYRRRSS